MLELRNVSYQTDDGKEILRNVSLQIDDRFVAVTGPNGSGKSTLAKLIAGIYTPRAGQILLDGEDITGLSITERANMGVSFALFLVYFLLYLVDAIYRGYLASSEIRLMIVITTTIVALGLLCLLVCKFLLRFRIREIVNKSIIDNIREL